MTSESYAHLLKVYTDHMNALTDLLHERKDFPVDVWHILFARNELQKATELLLELLKKE